MKITEATTDPLRIALDKIGSHPELPQQGEVVNTLSGALAHALEAQGDPLQHSSAVSSPNEQALALYRSALAGTAPAPSVPRVEPADLLGIQQYEELDIAWVGSFLHYLWGHRVPFPTHASEHLPILPMPDQASMAMAGDWGTDDPSSLQLGALIAEQQADYTIHLGDVYYSGTEQEEREKLVTPWPAGKTGAFALNSNHEMYSGGSGYFNVALQSPKFALQKGLSYFALENHSWLVVGLDSAYFARSCLFQQGDLQGAPSDYNSASQMAFLAGVGARAREGNKRLLVMTHHDALGANGEKLSLWTQLINALGTAPDYWYWGHYHAPFVFRPVVEKGKQVQARCCGHGGVPYSPAAGDPGTAIAWTETSLAKDPIEPRRALNGFAVLRFDGPSLQESFVDEKGSERWSSSS